MEKYENRTTVKLATVILATEKKDKGKKGATENWATGKFGSEKL